jgi:threonylcarbamoyladenosine tRNA methylthiotransferase MtaB
MEKGTRTVAFHTLGCKLNFSETSQIGRQLEQEGYKRVEFGEKADISVIHTCSVTGSADRKTRQAIKKAIKSSPAGYIVAMGCYAQLQPEAMASLEGVDLILGTRDKFNLPEYLKNTEKKDRAVIHTCGTEDLSAFFPAYSSGERTRAFLKVQDGCDYKCSYCTIPEARGKSRNPDIELLVQQAKNISSRGIKEIVLTGVNIGDFGKTTGQSFTELVRLLDESDIDARFRISSIEPNLLTDEIISITSGSKKITPHFHIPLQSGSDTILKLMRRRYPRETFRERVNKILELIPDAGIGADVIVGFPGEGDREFDETLNFLRSLEISYLHVFTFSERPGTPAAEMRPKVPNRIRDERSRILHDLSEEMKNRFHHNQTGAIREVIFERKTRDNRISGFTDNYIETEVLAGTEYLNTRQRVMLYDPGKGLMRGKIIENKKSL